MRPKNTAKEEAIRSIALKIIDEEGLENLSMQKLAQAAGVSPRTIYIKYENKEDFLIKLFIKEVLANYEQAVLKDFNEQMSFAAGIELIWKNAFQYLKNNRPSFALMQYGRSSPLLSKAFQEENIKQGQFFAPIHRFLKFHMKEGVIKEFPLDVHRALLFAPLYDLVSEYFDHQQRSKQIITQDVLGKCCEAVIKGTLK
jgi:TetR/AcrR family transcriptional regulator, multidrug resistance operon repressor